MSRDLGEMTNDGGISVFGILYVVAGLSKREGAGPVFIECSRTCGKNVDIGGSRIKIGRGGSPLAQYSRALTQ